jgi:integrase
MLEPQQLALIVDRMPEHYRLPVLVAYGAHLRLGEVIGLQRRDFLADRGAIRLDEQEYATGQRSGLKQREGRATTLPPTVAARLSEHLKDVRGFPRDAMFTRPLRPRERVQAQAAGLPLGPVPITRNGLQQAWSKAAKAVGLEGAYFHDVKQSSLTTAAQAGASLRELMDRARHKTARAALIYQHASEQRNAVIAERMDAPSEGLFGAPNGTTVARETPKAVES